MHCGKGSALQNAKASCMAVCAAEAYLSHGEALREHPVLQACVQAVAHDEQIRQAGTEQLIRCPLLNVCSPE
jgi:hypothetical protein